MPEFRGGGGRERFLAKMETKIWWKAGINAK